MPSSGVVAMSDDLDAEVARLTASGWSKPPPNLTDDDLAIAAKLMGKDNAQRLAKRKPGSRPFRPAPVRVEYLYYETHTGIVYQWRIERIVNGRRDGCRNYTFFEDMQPLLSALIKAGQTVRRITLGDSEPPRGLRPITSIPLPAEAPKRHRMAPPVTPPSQRRAILNQLARFRP